MNTIRIACIGAAALLAAAPAARAQAQDGNRWSWHGTVALGKTLEIRGVNGSIRAVASSGSEV
ncbi:MAG: hypothetical protein ABSB58_04645, partial [Gemmatimonadales bacterium]